MQVLYPFPWLLGITIEGTNKRIQIKWKISSSKGKGGVAPRWEEGCLHAKKVRPLYLASPQSGTFLKIYCLRVLWPKVSLRQLSCDYSSHTYRWHSHHTVPEPQRTFINLRLFIICVQVYKHTHNCILKLYYKKPHRIIYLHIFHCICSLFFLQS